MFGAAKPSDGLAAATKRNLLLGRVKYKQAQEARRARKQRSTEADRELVTLVDSFINGDTTPQPDEAELHFNEGSVEEADDGSDEEFWNNLRAGNCPRAEHIRNIPTSPLYHFMGRPSSSRMSRVARMQSEAGS